jgi:hypothetical protein
MPKCLNDPKKSYKGTEPSPKGLGYCAHGMNVGEKKKGKDGNIWIIKKVKNGSKRWMKVKEYDINKLRKILWNKQVKWWYKLSAHSILLIFKDGKFKFKKTDGKKGEEEWIEFGNDKNIKYILWSSISSDNLQQFIEFILNKCDNKTIEKFIKEKDTLKIIVKDFKKFCIEYKIWSEKDYLLKGYSLPFEKSKKKREEDEEKNKNKLINKFKKSKIILDKMII